MLKNLLLVGLGGAIGSALRYAATLLVSQRSFPYATLTVNILGSFLIGIILAWSIRNEILFNNWKLFLVTGLCGGFTTFSAFSLENLGLLQTGRYATAFAYMAISVVFGILAAYGGYQLMTKH